MLSAINGLHHVTSMASDANRNNAFFTDVLGLRRVKKTVNFDAPDVYHLYYGDERGTPGTVMTYFPFPNIGEGQPGTGEVGTTLFSVPEGSLGYWQNRFAEKNVEGVKQAETFGEDRLHFAGPDGDMFALVETGDDARAPWTGAGVKEDHAVRGFHGATMRLADSGAMAELLGFMNYETDDSGDGVRRFRVKGEGNGADIIELEDMPNVAAARLGAGSVHHIAFPSTTAKSSLKSASPCWIPGIG